MDILCLDSAVIHRVYFLGHVQMDNTIKIDNTMDLSGFCVVSDSHEYSTAYNIHGGTLKHTKTVYSKINKLSGSVLFNLFCNVAPLI